MLCRKETDPVLSWRILRRLLLLMLILPAVAGCDGESPPAPSSVDGGNPIILPKPPGKEAPVKTFGILYPMAHPFYEMITEQMEEASKLQQIQLTVKAPAETNVEQQILMMENMIKQHVDGIAISPIDPVALAPYVNKAAQQGIPVICFETDIPDSQRLSYIGTNPYKEGALMGATVHQQLGGKGMIIVQGGVAGSAREKSRLEGMLDYLSQNSKIQILDIRYHEGLSELALTNLEKMIDDHPHFDALVSMDIISSSTSILVWKAQGLKRNALTFGLTPEVKEALVNGQINSVISENEYLLGGSIIQQLLQATSGSTLSTRIETGIKVTTKNNAANR